jgi:RNase P/RNase MRP subunit p30
MKISTETRDELKSIAERDGITLDAALRKLLRAERQRRMGEELAQRPKADEDASWVVGSTAAVSRALR